MTWEAKAFLLIERKVGFSSFYFIYIWEESILSRINLRYFVLTQRKIKKWAEEARAGGKKEKERKEGKRGSFVWSGYYLPENISFEILNYRFFSLSSRKKVTCFVGFVGPSLFTHVWHPDGGGHCIPGKQIPVPVFSTWTTDAPTRKLYSSFQTCFPPLCFLFWWHCSEKKTRTARLSCLRVI